MAQPSTTQAEEVSAEARLQFAVRAIEKDPNLRFFLRQFLTFCNVLPPSSVYHPEDRQNAYNQGVQAAGFELSRMLTSAAPLLWPALLLEEMTDASENKE